MDHVHDTNGPSRRPPWCLSRCFRLSVIFIGNIKHSVQTFWLKSCPATQCTTGRPDHWQSNSRETYSILIQLQIITFWVLWILHGPPSLFVVQIITERSLSGNLTWRIHSTGTWPKYNRQSGINTATNLARPAVHLLCSLQLSWVCCPTWQDKLPNL